MSALISIITWQDARIGLPDDEQTVLLLTDDGEIWIGFHDSGCQDSQWRYTSADPVRVGVSHWAPIPEAPYLPGRRDAETERRGDGETRRRGDAETRRRRFRTPHSALGRSALRNPHWAAGLAAWPLLAEWTPIQWDGHVSLDVIRLCHYLGAHPGLMILAALGLALLSSFVTAVILFHSGTWILRHSGGPPWKKLKS
jgi:hypothetical protein